MKNKLELTWFNKDKSLYYDMKKGEYIWLDKNDPRVAEPRILIEKIAFGDSNSENHLIKGDNLLSLKSLETDFGNQIKLIYIDPPYNTGAAFEHYDDGLEHSIWLSMMKERLEILAHLLRDDGFICVHIDDSEQAYLKTLMDEILGRQNYLITIFIQVRYPKKTLKKDMVFHKLVEQVLVYRKTNKAIINQEESKISFDKFTWYLETKKPIRTVKLGGKTVEIFDSKNYKIKKGKPSKAGLKEIWASGSILDGNSSGRFFRDYLTGREKEDGYNLLYRVYDIGDDGLGYRYFTGPKRKGATRGKYYQGVPQKTEDKSISKRNKVAIPNFYDFAANFGNCRHEGGVGFKSGKKPEILLKTIINLFSNEGDWILDSFAGSGTTGAVAHKMGRNWIMIELGEHAETHCLKRLKDVVSGKDQTGISKEINWKGGGGFKYCILGESLFKFDSQLKFPFINTAYTNGPLIQAVCKMEGFNVISTKDPLHGQVGKRYAHITEQFVNQAYVDEVGKEITDEDSLAIYCLKYDSKIKLPENISIKRMPMALAKKFVMNG